MEIFSHPSVLIIGIVLAACLFFCSWQFKQLTEARNKVKALSKESVDTSLGSDDSVEDIITEKKIIAYKYKKLQSVLEIFPEGVVILDDVGAVTFSNIKLESLLGLSQAQILGRLPHEWCKNKPVLNLLTRNHNSRTRLRRTEVVEYSPEDKPDKMIAVSASPLSFSSSQDDIVGMLVTFRDISAEAMARRSRDDFVAHVSHELKSPLNVITMHSELLLDSGDDAQTRITSINVIKDEVERLATMVNDLLNITRLEVGSISINRKRTRFRDFLKDIFVSLQRQAQEKNIKFDLRLPSSLSHLVIDKDLLRIAINNILSNAIKYNKPGGMVKLLAEEKDDFIVLTIADTGIGISKEDQEKVFEKFYRSSNDGVTEENGHGLGLSLAQEIITLHNGRLTVESELGKGSAFTIELMKTSTLLKEPG